MNFTIGTIENWVANYYGLEVKASELNGYDELNFLLVFSIFFKISVIISDIDF